MASEPEVSEISSLFESFTRNRELALFLPFIFGFSSASPRRDSEDPHQETENPENPHRQRVILINPFTQGMMVIDGGSSLDALFREMGSTKNGRPPATKESIEAMGSVEIGEGEDGECAICLEEWEVGGVAKEMPCKHKFHGNCIEKWLGIHGNCPVCRYEMPVEEKEVGKKDDDDGDEGEERRRRQVWVVSLLEVGIRIKLLLLVIPLILHQHKEVMVRLRVREENFFLFFFKTIVIIWGWNVFCTYRDKNAQRGFIIFCGKK